MRVAVLNQYDAEKLCNLKNNVTIAMISISSPFSATMPKVFKSEQNGIIDILSLKFNDTENTDALYKGINKEQATKIVDFVNRYKGEIDLMVIHCYQGKSRSAGVAAAILEMLQNDGDSILSDKRYDVNKLVYITVLNAFKQKETESK